MDVADEVLAIRLIVAVFIYAFKLPGCGRPPSYSNVGKYEKAMQYILKNTAKNPESIFVQTVNTSELCYHPLFETFQNDVLLLDAETGTIPKDINLPGIDQLPASIDDQVQGIRSRENVANLLHTQAKSYVQNPKFTPTEKM